MGVEGCVGVVKVCVSRVEGEGGWTCGRVDRSKWSRICSCSCSWSWCAECIGRGDVGLLDQTGVELEGWCSIWVCGE